MASMTDEDLQPKLIYLARRHPALTREAFTPRWRQHGALGMSRPRWRNIARYVHGDVIDRDDRDGLGLIWHRSRAARSAHLADTDSRLQMEQDENETFAEPIANVCLLAREYVLRGPPAMTVSSTGRADPDGPVKLTRFLQTHAPADATDLRLRLDAAELPLLGHIINLPLPPERGDAWGLRCACIEELWFANLEDARRATQVAAAAPGSNAATLSVLTRDVLLYQIQAEG
jgi:hypothetical protein